MGAQCTTQPILFRASCVSLSSCSGSSAESEKVILLDRGNRIAHQRASANDKYEIARGATGILHRGMYASLVKAQNKRTGAWTALKQVKKCDAEKVALWQHDVEVHKQLDHPHICRLFDTLEGKQDLSQVLELCLGQNITGISDLDKSLFTEAFCAVLTRQMLSAVCHLHAKEICHADLQSESFLFTKPMQPGKRHSLVDFCLKLVDLGFAWSTRKPVDFGKQVSSGKATKNVFSPSKATWAPERSALEAQGRDHAEKVYGAPLDVWSIGTMAYFLLSGTWPAVAADTKVNPAWENISSEGSAFTAESLDFEPKKRPQASELLNGGWMTLAQRAYNEAAHAVALADREGRSEESCEKKTSGLSTPLVGADDVLTSLQALACMTELERAAVTAVAHNLPEEKVAHLRTIFEQMDCDGDGALSVEEMRRSMAAGMGPIDGVGYLDSLLVQLDTDGSGQIEYTEFLAATYAFRRNFRDDICDAAFRVFDKDNSGTISADEVIQLLGRRSSSKESADSASRTAAINQYDSDGNGEIDKEEFKRMLQGSAAPSLHLCVHKAAAERARNASQDLSETEVEDNASNFSQGEHGEEMPFNGGAESQKKLLRRKSSVADMGGEAATRMKDFMTKTRRSMSRAAGLGESTHDGGNRPGRLSRSGTLAWVIDKSKEMRSSVSTVSLQNAVEKQPAKKKKKVKKRLKRSGSMSEALGKRVQRLRRSLSNVTGVPSGSDGEDAHDNEGAPAGGQHCKMRERRASV